MASATWDLKMSERRGDGLEHARCLYKFRDAWKERAGILHFAH